MIKKTLYIIFAVMLWITFCIIDNANAAAIYEFYFEYTGTSSNATVYTSTETATADVCTGHVETGITGSYKGRSYFYPLRRRTISTGVVSTSYQWQVATQNTPDIEFINSGCVECNSPYVWNTQTGVCDPPPCDPVEKLNKEEECGGANLLRTWDNDACIGYCYCEEDPIDDPETIQFASLAGFCGGASLVDNWSSDQCMGECKGCDTEYHNKEVECAELGLLVNKNSPNASNCEYECDDPAPCLEEFEAKEKECGFWGINPATKNFETCTAECAQTCDDQYLDLKKACGIAGIASFDNETCTGTCRDCDWSRKDCDSSCVSGFGKQDCSQRSNNGVLVSVNYGKCECIAPEELMQTPPGDEGGTTYDGKEFANGIPGSHGGTVVKNPDGTYTETCANGTVFKYSADGKTVTAVSANGQTLTSTKDGDTTTYTGTGTDGAFSRITLEANPDGTLTKTVEKGVDINANNPELSPELVVSDTETEIVNGDSVPTYSLDGTEIENPKYDTTEEEKTAGLTIAGKYQSNESYDWHERVDFTGWNAAKLQWEENSPAGIYSHTIEPLVNSMVKTPTIPKWTIHFPSVGRLPAFDFTIDLSAFDIIVPWLRFFIAVGMVIKTLINVPKLWSHG